MPELRADARRNYARLLEAAEVEVAAHGAGAALEAIARRAGVGSATARRHFPTRRALVEAVSHSRIEVLAARARELHHATDPRAALLEWLDLVVTYCLDARGLAAALSYDGATPEPTAENSCSADLERAGEPLLRRAVQDGSVTTGATVADLIALVVGIVLATAAHPDRAERARHLLGLVATGLGPPTASARVEAPLDR